MEQKGRTKKRKEKREPGIAPDAPVLQDFYIDPGTRLDDSTAALNPDVKDMGIQNLSSVDHTTGTDPGPIKTNPEHVGVQFESSAPPMDLSEMEDSGLQSSAPAMTTGERTLVNGHRELNMDLQRFAPHQMLHPQLQTMREEMDDLALESSAPPLETLEAPPMEGSAPLGYKELNSNLQHLAPHQILQPQLAEMRKESLEEKEERFEDCLVEVEPLKEEDIVPFTESQLHALYHNVELEKNAEFVEHWLETQENIEKFPLDELLVNYLRVRALLCSAKRQYQDESVQATDLMSNLWILGSDKVEEEGECECGNTVILSREARTAEYCDSTAFALKQHLKSGKEKLAEDYSLYSWRSEVLRIGIDDFLDVVVRRQHGAVPPSVVYSPQEELRLTISVLFKFLRKETDDDKVVKDLRGWCDRVVACLHHQATLYDHLFLLNHIMRCPAGVGRWAAHYIQPALPLTDPEEAATFDNPFLDHLITLLATVLLPVKERARFLYEHRVRFTSREQDDQQQDRVWCVLDQEGSEEEDPEETWAGLRESDLISLANQIPVDAMFRYVLRVETRDEKDHYSPNAASHHSFLRLYAFTTQFVLLLREGLRTFNTPRYRQFAKRLGRLIRHTVHYVSDHWQAFKLAQGDKLDPSMLLRLQVEYDNFFLRAARCIFSSQKLGTWQYLADIPFATISPRMLWRIFYTLHLDYQEESHGDFGGQVEDWETALDCPDLLVQFEEKCSEAGETELYFLLSAFANMAMSRGKEDRRFIERAMLDIFHVGFVCETTREGNSKNCRDLLTGVTSTHPFLLSTLLASLSERVGSVGKFCGLLFQELPWASWRPQAQDMQLLLTWLAMPPASIHSHLSRTILTRLNWGFGVLPPSLHVDVAIAITEAETKHAASEGEGMVASGVGTVTSLVTTNPANQFTTWAWETLSRLHLHMMDRGDQEALGMMNGDPAVHGSTLDYYLNPQVEAVVAAAVAKQPIAAYTAILLTQVGHSLPEILERGLPLLRHVLEAGRLDHTMEVLKYIIPLLLADPSSLQNAGLQAVLVRLLAADQTYLSLAKSLITGAFPGPVTRELGNLVEVVLADWRRLGLTSARPLVQLWTNLLTSLPQWNSNPSCLFLVDLLCRHSMEDQATRQQTLELFRDLHRKFLCDLSSQGLINWITGINYSTLKHLFSSSLPQFPWLAHFVLTAEEEHWRECGLWGALVQQLGHGKPLEEALAGAGREVETSPPPSSQLPLYRWLTQALDTAPDHPSLPLLWQGFLRLFLARPQPQHAGEEPRGVGMAFFQGMMNSMYFAKVKTALKGLLEYHTNADTEEERKGFKEHGRLFKALNLWLEEAKVLDSTLYIPALSPAYWPDRLASLLAGDRALWLEFLPPNMMQEEQGKAVDEWKKMHFRSKLQALSRKPYCGVSNLAPTDRILRRLQSYEPRLPGPVLKMQQPPIPSLALDASLLPTIQQHLSLLNEFTVAHNSNVSAFGSLNCSYLELVPSLWREEEIEVVSQQNCPGTGTGKQRVDCCGPAVVTLCYSEAQLQDTLHWRLQENRKEWESVEQKLLAIPSPKFVTAATTISATATRLLLQFEKQLKGRAKEDFRLQGLELLYMVAEAVEEDWLSCPALRHWASELLETLASVLISSTPGEAPRLLSTLSAAPHLSPFLSPHFSPNISDTEEVLSLYTSLAVLPDGDGALPFVLLSKLDLGSWLSTSSTPSSRSSLISTLGRCLARSGPEPPDQRAMLHGLHRRHLMLILAASPSHHYIETLRLLLALTEGSTLDPAVWLDLLNCLTANPGRFSLQCQSRDERLQAAVAWAEGQGRSEAGLGGEAASLLTSHFQQERLQFGLYGLYPKYRVYVDALATLLAVLGGQMVATAASLTESWPHLEALYAPWLMPLQPGERGSAAVWIQHLTDSTSALPPWIPGDAASAASVLASLLSCLQSRLAKEERANEVLVLIWQLYCRQWGAQGSKEHVQGVVHPALLALPWHLFRPSLPEVESMVRLMGQFAPTTHSFLGAIFLKVPWASRAEELGDRLLPALLLLLVKLSGEPSVRQTGSLLPIIEEAETWDWICVEPAHFESLAQWFVMSVDCRVVLKHPERSVLDEAVINLLRAGAGFNLESSERGAAKQRVWVKCIAKLLSSCGSKQRNFLAHHQPALHTSLRKVLEDVALISVSSPQAANSLVKDYLATLNGPSTSVLPGSALMVLQSWLAASCPSAILLHALLAQTGVVVTDAKSSATALESVLEAKFQDTGSENQPSWSTALQHTSWPPTPPRLQAFLSAAVSQGNALLLHAHIRHRQPGCTSAQEERLLAVSLLEWIRDMAGRPAALGLEPKLPLLYRQLVVLLQRQAKHTADLWVVGAVSQLCDLLLQIADSSPGWGQNLLGAIGLSTSAAIGVRGKFLARALFLFLRVLLTEDRTQLVERTLEEGEGGREQLLALAEVKPQVDKVTSLKRDKGMAGIHDLIDWTLAQVSDGSNSLADAHLFIDHLVVNKLYLDLFLQN